MPVMRTSSLLLACLAWLTPPALAQEVSTYAPEAQEHAPEFMRVYGPVDPPQAFARFCDVHPRDCLPTAGTRARVAGTPSQLAELEAVNVAVNLEIQAEADLAQYGVADLWTFPVSGRGDCEDFALLKRRRLIELQWPANALLMTVVRTGEGEGHAVLTVRTAAGDFILDNKTDAVRPWTRTPYHFLMRQSSINPAVWLDLDTAEDRMPSVAGVHPAR